jgi:hypothetical protein
MSVTEKRFKKTHLFKNCEIQLHRLQQRQQGNLHLQSTEEIDVCSHVMMVKVENNWST